MAEDFIDGHSFEKRHGRRRSTDAKWLWLGRLLLGRLHVRDPFGRSARGSALAIYRASCMKAFCRLASAPSNSSPVQVPREVVAFFRRLFVSAFSLTVAQRATGLEPLS